MAYRATSTGCSTLTSAIAHPCYIRFASVAYRATATELRHFDIRDRAFAPESCLVGLSRRRDLELDTLTSATGHPCQTRCLRGLSRHFDPRSVR